VEPIQLAVLDDIINSPGKALAVVVVLAGCVIVLGFLKWLLRFYVKVDQGKALIVNTLKPQPTVTFTGHVVLPVIHRAELMDISVKTIEIDRKGNEGLICQDNIRADIKVTFFVRINNTEEAVLTVAQSIGCERASRQDTVEQLFQAKFSEALKTVGRKMDFVELYQERTMFKEEIIKTIGKDLNGYVLEDAAIDYLEQTPITSLSPDNILDAQGIKKITELTAAEKIKANEIRRNQEKVITQQDVDTREKILELQRQQSEAEIRQKKEIDVIRAREEAEAKKIASEELSRSEQARLKAEEEIAVADQNKQRQAQIAEKNKERVVGIETERVAKDRNLEIIARERAVELQRIEKEKALEVERKNIQDVIRERVAVEKTVAEEEERIKDTRTLMTAERAKKAAVIGAEQAALEEYTKDVKAAEAQEMAAKHKANETLTIAQAELTKAQKVAEGKMRLAEGITAETAAEGLARVQVKEADAAAIEKVGIAEARALREKVDAEASGISLKGTAEATALSARAAANEKLLLAEATGVREKILAEAAGITKKADAMKALDEASRGHEEFRLRLEKEKSVELAEIAARQRMIADQAVVLAEALKNAKIEIVGGDGQFFDRFVQAITGGKSIDAFVNKSEVVQRLGKDYLAGDGSIVADIKEILTKANLNSDDLKNLSVTALLTKLATETSDDGTRKKLNRLLTHAQDLGLSRPAAR
jgi:uncharacterized membrane protein YqiK